ncbi:hypothetical protein OKW41_003585 [Paraburkholderia sp. UCT70]
MPIGGGFDAKPAARGLARLGGFTTNAVDTISRLAANKPTFEQV